MCYPNCQTTLQSRCEHEDLIQILHSTEDGESDRYSVEIHLGCICAELRSISCRTGPDNEPGQNPPISSFTMKESPEAEPFETDG